MNGKETKYVVVLGADTCGEAPSVQGARDPPPVGTADWARWYVISAGCSPHSSKSLSTSLSAPSLHQRFSSFFLFFFLLLGPL